MRQTIQFLALMAVISTCSAIPAAEFSIDRSPQEEDTLIDGTVAREWGDFIRARDIRINCRAVQSVVRNVPRPEDYFTKCHLKTEFDHPYAEFTDRQLEQIADYDAEAAYLLAHRLLIQPSVNGQIPPAADPSVGLSHAMNALIISGEQQVYDLLLDGRHFRNWMVWSTVGGEPSEKQVIEKQEEYIWTKAGLNLGFVAEEDRRWRKLSRQMSSYRDYFDFEEMDATAQRISDGVAKRRSMITGQ